MEHRHTLYHTVRHASISSFHIFWRRLLGSRGASGDALKCRVLCSGASHSQDGWTVLRLLLCSLSTVEISGRATSKLIPTHNGTIKVYAFCNPFATGLGQMVRWVEQISRNWPKSKSRVIAGNLSQTLAFLLAATSVLLCSIFPTQFVFGIDLILSSDPLRFCCQGWLYWLKYSYSL